MRPLKVAAFVFALAGLITLFAVENPKVSSACILAGVLLSFVDDYRSGAFRRD